LYDLKCIFFVQLLNQLLESYRPRSPEV